MIRNRVLYMSIYANGILFASLGSIHDVKESRLGLRYNPGYFPHIGSTYTAISSTDSFVMIPVGCFRDKKCRILEYL